MQDSGIVGDDGDRPLRQQRFAKNGGHRTVIDDHGHAGLDQIERGLGDRPFDVGLLQLPETEIAFELHAGIDGGAAAHLAQHAGAFQLVEIAMDGHFRDGEAVRQIVEVDGMVLDQQVDDFLSAFFALHALIPVPSGPRTM